MAPSRRTMARQHGPQTRATWLVPVFIVTTTIGLATAFLIFLFTRPARSLECITSENTYCRDEITQNIATLEETRFLLASGALRQKEQALKAAFPDLIEVELRRTLSWKVLARVTLAKPLLTIELNGQSTVLRENGHLSAAPTLSEGEIPFILTATASADQLLPPWNKQEQKNLAQLSQSLAHFRPRIRRVEAQEPTKVTAFPEGFGPIFLRVDEKSDVLAQLSTLQAFFRSTTMEKPYEELDVRFSHLVVKE